MLKGAKKMMQRGREKQIIWKKICRISIIQRSHSMVSAEVNVCQWYGFSTQQQCWWMGAHWPFILCVCECVCQWQYLSISRRDERMELNRNFLLSERTLNHYTNQARLTQRHTQTHVNHFLTHPSSQVNSSSCLMLFNSYADATAPTSQVIYWCLLCSKVRVMLAGAVVLRFKFFIWFREVRKLHLCCLISVC